jgi:hypothetical protein
MRTIKSFDDALDFYPAPALRPALSRFGDVLRTYWNALRNGMTAARAYQELTSRGVPHDVAARHIFTAHFNDC